jgi:hypothetical protein
MRIHRFLLLVLLLTTVSALAEACPNYVASSTPSIFSESKPPLVPKTDCITVSIGSHPFLVAVYSNDVAALSIFDPSTNPPVLLHQDKEPMFGSVFDLSATDLDGDGRKEIVVQTRSRMSEMLWAYKLADNGAPTLITPATSSGGPITGAKLLDLDGTGKISIVDTKADTETTVDGDTSVAEQYTLFALQDGKYVEQTNRTIVFVHVFERNEGTPTAETVPVDVPEAGRYRLTLLNGDSSGKNRCSSVLVNSTLSLFRRIEDERFASSSETTFEQV